MSSSQPRRTYVVWLTTFERAYTLFPSVVEATSHDEAAEKAPVPPRPSISSVIVCDAVTGASRRFQVSRTVEVSALDGEVAQ